MLSSGIGSRCPQNKLLDEMRTTGCSWMTKQCMLCAYRLVTFSTSSSSVVLATALLGSLRLLQGSV